MSLSPSLLAAARAAYRDVLRASSTTFSGDVPIRDAFRSMIRTKVLTSSSYSGTKELEKTIKDAREIADVLRKNVAQAVKTEEARDPESCDVFKLRITEHTELGTNDTIKSPPPMESSRSARKKTTSTDAVKDIHSTQIPKYYSHLKRAHKQRVIPQLREEDIKESFVRGSGPGGQSINKTENNVQLLHKPTGIRVSCQETRSLSQNRKIARRLLTEKLDALYNPGLSKQEVKKALQQERERRRKKKARKQEQAKGEDSE